MEVMRPENVIDRLPVIIGVGEIVDRPKDQARSKEPIILMKDALRAAEQDAGVDLISKIDSLDVVNEISWPYRNPIGLLTEILGISPSHTRYGEVGGQTPVQFIHEAASRIYSGRTLVAAICGAEAENAVRRAERQQIELPWHPRLENFKPIRGAYYQKSIARTLNVATPAHVYPFYENATLAAWRQTPKQADDASAALWMRYSVVAASRPASWSSTALTEDAIKTVTPQNRMIAWPYPKLMVANPDVNMGAAVLVTSFANAKALGVSEEKMVFVWGGAAASEPRDYLMRDKYTRSTAMEATLRKALHVAEVNGEVPAHYELYSCFPTVPKMAARMPGIDPDTSPTVTGGLTFFGAPLNNYMTHAAVAMVQTLRGADTAGLLFGQGEYVTKHHSLVLANKPPETPFLGPDYSVQRAADASLDEIPEFADGFSGRAVLETFTVLFNRDGSVAHGIVISRAPDGKRLLAKVPAEDVATLQILMDREKSPVGQVGEARLSGDVIEWHCA